MTKRLDPYWTWADLTDRRYLRQEVKRRLRLMLEPRPGHDNDTLAKLAQLANVKLSPTCATTPTAFMSAWIEEPDNEKLSRLMQYASVVLAEPGMRPIDAARLESNAPQGLGSQASADVSLSTRPVVVGVVDGRCGFANKSFCSSGEVPESCIDFFWDQANEPAADWMLPRGFGYGRELGRNALNGALRKHLSKEQVTRQGTRAEAEKTLYRALDHTLPMDADWSHGTHVLDTVLTDYRASTVHHETEPEPPGVIYVQLPDAALYDTSGRWAASYVLDALHYILDRAGKYAQVVVNLSLGSFAGPHDGSSLLERAIDQLVTDSKHRLSVVVAAGNAGQVVDDGTGQRRPCHARVSLDAAHASGRDDSRQTVKLDWLVDVADSTESFMEIWLPASASVRVSLRREGDPDAERIVAEPGDVRVFRRTVTGTVCAALINMTGENEVPNGNGGIVLVALAHTRSASEGFASTGTWVVEVTNTSPFPVTLDAWIERRDVPGELVGFRPQYGFRPGTSGLTGKGSLGTLANGRNTIVVGAADFDETRCTFEPSPYSSVGVAGVVGACNARGVARLGPDFFGIGKRTATGFLTGSSKGLAGTSMAAAQVTGALARAAATATKGAGSLTREHMLDLLSTQSARRRAPGTRGPPSASGGPRLPDVDGRPSEQVLPSTGSDASKR